MLNNANYKCALTGFVVTKTHPTHAVTFWVEVTKLVLVPVRLQLKVNVDGVRVPRYVNPNSPPPILASRGGSELDADSAELILDSNLDHATTISVAITVPDVQFSSSSNIANGGSKLFEIQFLDTSDDSHNHEIIARIKAAVAAPIHPDTSVASADKRRRLKQRIQLVFGKIFCSKESISDTLRNGIIETPGYFNMGSSGRTAAIGVFIYLCLLFLLWFTANFEVTYIIPTNCPSSQSSSGLSAWPSKASALYYNETFGSKPPSWFEGNQGWMVLLRSAVDGDGLCPLGAVAYADPPSADSVTGNDRIPQPLTRGVVRHHDACIGFRGERTIFQTIDDENGAAGYRNTSIVAGIRADKAALVRLDAASCLVTFQLVVAVVVLWVIPRLTLMSHDDDHASITDDTTTRRIELKAIHYTRYYRICEICWIVLFLPCFGLVGNAFRLIHYRNDMSGNGNPKAWSTTFFRGCTVLLKHGPGFITLVVDLSLLCILEAWLVCRRILSWWYPHQLLSLPQRVAVDQLDDSDVAEVVPKEGVFVPMSGREFEFVRVTTVPMADLVDNQFIQGSMMLEDN